MAAEVGDTVNAPPPEPGVQVTCADEAEPPPGCVKAKTKEPELEQIKLVVTVMVSLAAPLTSPGMINEGPEGTGAPTVPPAGETVALGDENVPYAPLRVAPVPVGVFVNVAVTVKPPEMAVAVTEPTLAWAVRAKPPNTTPATTNIAKGNSFQMDLIASMHLHEDSSRLHRAGLSA